MQNVNFNFSIRYFQTSRSEDLASQIGQGLDKAKEEIGITTEKKGLFDSFKEKAGNFYDAAVEKGKEAYHATKEAVSDGIDKVKEKVNEFRDKKPESPVETLTNP